MLFYYLRHADPIYNPDSLTTLGTRQAEALARRLSVHGIDKIFASSSNRAQLTAKPTSEITKKPITVLDWAHEKNFYSYASKTAPDGKRYWFYQNQEYKEIMVSKECRALGDNWYKHPVFDESFAVEFEKLKEEVYNFIKELGYEHDEETGTYIPVCPNNDRVALFAHQGIGLAILSIILDIPYPIFAPHMDMSHSCMSIIEFSDTCWCGNHTPYGSVGKNIIPRMLSFANDSHLYREGLPTMFTNSFYL